MSNILGTPHRWVVLFSQPSDFTPVCANEAIGFATLAEEFHAQDADLVALSQAGQDRDMAWLAKVGQEAAYQGLDSLEATIPVLEDPSGSVAEAYGLGDAETEAHRVVLVIDPGGVLVALLVYPSSVSRNFEEVLRLVRGLRATEGAGFAA